MKTLQVMLPLALLLAGCSTNFQMPWDVNLLDPGRVQTREPLEIPPDLNVLPTPDNPQGVAFKEPGRPAATSASAILFNAPTSRRTSEQPSRQQRENLPNWLSSKGQR